MLKLVSRFGGDPNEKELDRLQPLVAQVAELEPSYIDLTDGQLRDKTAEFLRRLSAGESLDDLLPEAFAAVREASKRTTSMRHFDVQILGGIILHQGKVVEMKTGEGKTLVATLPLYLNALAGHGAHLITVNDYLARRDVQWMGPIYHLLGLSVGLLQQGEGNAFVYDPDHTGGSFKYLRSVDRGEAYGADITYGTNHEFGFDYLRDNLAFSLERRVQREPHYAIIDEVDNILIDEARTPLIISGPSDEPLEEYKSFARIARKLRADIDYELDEKEHNVILTEAGLAKVEAETGIENIYDEANYQYVHYMEQALRAQVLFHKGRDYIRQGQRVVLVDEFTGRLMPDRRLSEGLHQAIEAKEGVPIRARMMTQATITLQNYFRMYEKLAGMTGTAATEAEELDKIYKLDVIVLPTNVEYMARSADSRLVEQRRKEEGVEILVYCDQDGPDEVLFYKRVDYQDAVYKSEKAKWEAITEEIKELHEAGRPVLVGTTSVEKSELLSGLLKAKGIPHEVLNAKNHTREAAIIARAGEPEAVTIATNMAGRGVDIKLGGELSEETIRTAHRLLRGRGIDPYHASPAQLYSAIAEVDPDYVRRREQALELGGLHVLGTERHEARRIDNQLRGRAGRQGEPGSSRFFLSLEDDLMRRFGGPSVASLMDRLGVEEDIPIEHGMVSKTIEGAQTKVEGYNFDIRKHLLEYDDVLNRQRELIYGRRYRFLTSNDLEPELWDMLESELDSRLDGVKQDDGVALLTYLNEVVPLALAPPDAPFSYQLPFLGKLTCFPPFTILFLQDRLADQPRERMPEALLQLSRQASDAYRQHLLETIVREPFENALEQYDEILSQYVESLENKVEDYTSLMEEQDRSLNTQDLLQYVQNVFPIPLKVKASELRNLSISDATDELVTRLRDAYHQELGDRLLRMVQTRTPADLKLDQIRVSDVAPEQLERLAASSASGADESRRTRLTQLMEGKRALLETLLQASTQEYLDLASLRIVLSLAVEVAYDRWAQRQLEEMSSALSEREARLHSASEEDLLLILLEVTYSERAEFDKGHLKRLSFAPRFPLPFLALPLLRELRQEELREMILEQLEAALTARQDTWGRQEVSRLGQSTLGELDDDLREGLAEHLGASILEAAEGLAVGEMDGELHRQVQAYLGLRQLEGVRLGDLEGYEGFEEYLERKLGRELAETGGDVDERLAAQIEEYLRAQGYFEDADARQSLLLTPLVELDSTVQESIARRAGLLELARLRDMPVAEWDADSRMQVKEFLQGQGHFVDEQKVQRFFVHGNMEELGDEMTQQACAFMAAKQLKKWDTRTIASLKGELRETVLAHLQQLGLLVDETKRESLQGHTLAQIDEATEGGLSSYLGARQLEAAAIVSALPSEALDDLERRLREEEYFTDQERLASVQQAKVSDLDEATYEAVRQDVVGDLEGRLDSKLIGELPPYLQQIIRRHLRGTDYFVDEEKIRQADSLTLSALDGSTVRDLEQAVGDRIVASFEQRKFMNLDQEVRESVLHYLDLEGLFRKKKKREQFVKNSLADLDKGIKDGVAYHLGRERLSELREVRLPDLPEELRQEILEHLRETGYFVDTEKEEYLEIEEVKDFDPELRRGLLAAVEQGLERLLSERTLADLPEEIQAGILQRLEQEEYFVDRERLGRFRSASVSELEAEAYALLNQHLGRRTLAGIEDQRVSDLSGDLRHHVEDYLEGSDYFVDQAKVERFMQRRIVDLGEDVVESLSQRMGQQLALETKGSAIAALDKNEREYLRDYLDSVGHFLDEEAVARFEHGSLADLGLDTREQESLASWLGRGWVQKNGERTLSELEQSLQAEIQRSLLSSDYLLNSEALQRFREKGIAELDEQRQEDVVRHLATRQAEEIADRQWGELEEETRHDVEHFLADSGFGLDDAAMAEFEGRKLVDLDEEMTDGLARYLGHQRLAQLGDSRIAELDEQTKSDVERFVGKQLMHRIEKQLMMGFTSKLWVDYLTAIEDLRQGIGLQAYAQIDPLVEYKRRAFRMFGELNDNINRMVVGNVFRYPPQPLRLAQGGQR